MQKLIFAQPDLLPLEAIDANYSKLIPLNREVVVPSGEKIDNLYLMRDGTICIVETKLFRNPEAHLKGLNIQS